MSRVAVLAPHSTRRRYQQGCRCEECTRSNARYKADRQAANKARTQAATEAYRQTGGQGGIPSLDHGKPATYYWWGCRCEQCKEVVRPIHRQYKRIRRVIQLAEAI